MFSLFQAITGGRDWNELSDPLVDIHPVLGFLFAMYIAFAVLCVLNVVTGVFVEHTESDSILEDMAMRRQYIMEMRDLFVQNGTDPEELTLDREQFEARVNDERLQAYFSKFGLHVDEQNSYSLFEI